MTSQILDWLQWTKDHVVGNPDNILEIGSLNVNGSPRSVYNQRNYLGVDQTSGHGVDMVANGHELPLPDSFYDLVICCEVLEHDPNFWLTLKEVNRVIKPTGYLIITTPTTGFPEHRFPVDCYRFMVDSYREFLFQGYDIVNLTEIVDPSGQPGICCLGRKISLR